MEAIKAKLHEEACKLYNVPTYDCSQIMYKYFFEPIAEETILYGLESRNWYPPVKVLQHLWTKFGHHDPKPFFSAGTFRHRAVWTHIVQELAADGKWDVLCSTKAMQPAGWDAHMTCSYMYANALVADDEFWRSVADDEERNSFFRNDACILKLGASFVECELLHEEHLRKILYLMEHEGHFTDGMCWLNVMDGTRLAFIVDELVQWNGVDHLLQRVAAEDMDALREAVRRFPNAQSHVANLARPADSLSDEQILQLLHYYRFTPLCQLEWHTQGLLRDNHLLLAETDYGPPPQPTNLHELFYALRMDLAPKMDDLFMHLLAKALRLMPVVCDKLSNFIHPRPSLANMLETHQYYCFQTVRLAGNWPLPNDCLRHIALYL